MMHDISRRKFLRAAAPLAAAPLVAGPLAAGLLSNTAFGKTPSTPPALTLSDQARQRIQKHNLPNIPLITHEGKRVLFYDDLIKDKAVSLNFFYANCDEVCPRVMANLAAVQKDKDKTQHIGNIRYGNEPLMLWSACPGMAHATWIAETLEWMVHPEQNRVQTP